MIPRYGEIWLNGTHELSSCGLCGAIIQNETTHDKFHDALETLGLRL